MKKLAILAYSIGAVAMLLYWLPFALLSGQEFEIIRATLYALLWPLTLLFMLGGTI